VADVTAPTTLGENIPASSYPMFLYNPWDEPISRPMLRCWREFVDALETLPVLRIPRWTSLSTDTSGVELHVFCDASTRAYAAALYVRFPVSNDCFKTTLFTSKSKVSPLPTVTVPRLELCAAQLGVRLLRHVLKENRFSKCPITAWSDSQVALAWIHGHPSRWKTFVANRVSYIQTSLPSLRWKYVPSSDNSADVASHGTEPELLRDSPLWWQGPPWLSQGEGCWPKKVLQDVTSPGEEAPRHLLSNVVRIEEEPWTLLSRYSSIAKLLRVTALCVRFYRRCRSRDAPDLSRVAEIRDAKLRLIRCEQRRCYPVPFAERHPPILPKTSPLAEHFIRNAHAARQRHLDHIVPTASGVDSRGTVDGEEVHQVLRSLFPLPTASRWAADGSTPSGSSHPGSTLL
jgi:hypothetical protein